MKIWTIWRARGGGDIRWYENGNNNTLGLSAADVFELVKTEADCCGNWEKDCFRGEKEARIEWEYAWEWATTDAYRLYDRSCKLDADVYQLVCEHYDDDKPDKFCKAEVFEIAAAPLFPDRCRQQQRAVRMYPWGEKVEPYTVAASVCGAELHWKLYDRHEELATIAVTRCCEDGCRDWSGLQHLACEWLTEHGYESGRIEVEDEGRNSAEQWHETVEDKTEQVDNPACCALYTVTTCRAW